MTTSVSGPSNTLGNRAKSLHTPGGPGRDRDARRAPVSATKRLAYDLRAMAGRLLFDGQGGKRQRHRVCHCGRSLQGLEAQIFRAPDGSRARIAGTVTCGSGWTCSVCARKIGEARRLELEAANVGWVKAGGYAHLITLTFPHQADESLADLMARFDKARNRFRNSRAWKRLLHVGKGAAGCLGTVSSLEVTHGANGWHPHLHLIAFVQRPLTVAEVDTLTAAWVHHLVKVGMRGDITDMMAHALDCRGGEDAAAYITKYGREESWGLSSELTASHAKAFVEEGPDKGHRKPFGLLLDASAGDAHAAALFKEFAEVFHGKRLITWSPGLREWCGLGDDIEDEAVAENSDVAEASQFVGALTAEQWKVVLSRHAVAELEEYAAASCVNPDTGQADLDDFVSWIAGRPARSGGWFWTPMRRPWVQ